MDEIDYRINAHEMALVEVAAQIDQDNVIAAMWTIRAGLVDGISEEDRTIRLRALDLLDVALERADMNAAMGLHWRGSPKPGLDAVRMLEVLLSQAYPPGDD